jgi:hypothetical protein
MRTDRNEAEILRVSLARIAQCGPAIEQEIPGAAGRTELEFSELSRLAREHDRGWNRLAVFVVGHCRERFARGGCTLQTASGTVWGNHCADDPGRIALSIRPDDLVFGSDRESWKRGWVLAPFKL